MVICAHTLAETYGILTRLPVPYRIVPTMAEELIRRSVLPHAHVVALSEDDYLQAIERVAGVGLTGAVIYDALLLAAATKAKAHHILTSDTHHFSMLSPETEGFILAP